MDISETTSVAEILRSWKKPDFKMHHTQKNPKVVSWRTYVASPSQSSKSWFDPSRFSMQNISKNFYLPMGE